ncbi:phosphoglucomutase/phosphomannomutase PgmG [Novosphingobium sp. Leaf2]|uniref:phosphoglucomutase/phosphomannomutase PgmG n=1 Tax=Novosphingobium sp. Leaf2 TaxID=1735670 RepID=UPI0006FC73DE|nr:phosphomannomutase/phosphoglucomutase [Novosphingobium sp. Leaf2]KQM20283.1 phosphomannomutase [Novosphingobium sp. Leaf2]
MNKAHQFDPTILREYDIRGVVGETLGAPDAHALGLYFAAVLRKAGGGRVVVGRDGRLSSPMLETALVEGLTLGGVDVVRIGLAATPMLYFAETSLPQVDGGIQVTGSHNPGNHNGFKIVLGGRPFFGPDIQRLGATAAAGEGTGALTPGLVTERDVLSDYVDRLLEGLAGTQVNDIAALRIGWDAGNGAAGPALELLTSRLTARFGGEHHLLYSDVDGRFPNHHPDPTVLANLADLQALVAAKNLDFGVAFDGDADRIGVVDARGRIVDADQLLAIYARDVLARQPGARVIADVKASRLVFDTVRALGGQVEMAPSGHSHIKSRMKATGALLGGETSGHIFLADDYYGFDDGLYAAVRLMAASQRLAASVTQLGDLLPAMHNTPELRFPVPDARKFAVIDDVRKRLSAANVSVDATDGVRVDTPNGWWLLRASNTQAALTARAESDTAAGLDALLAQVDSQLAQSGITRG